MSAVRGQLLEKDLILEELDSLTAKLQGALAAAHPSSSGAVAASSAASAAGSAASDQQLSGAPLVARQVADVQARAGGGGREEGGGGHVIPSPSPPQAKLKDITRHMMATVSELSMYQATAIKLGAETEAAHQVLAQARSRRRGGACTHSSCLLPSHCPRRPRRRRRGASRRRSRRSSSTRPASAQCSSRLARAQCSSGAALAPPLSPPTPHRCPRAATRPSWSPHAPQLSRGPMRTYRRVRGGEERRAKAALPEVRGTLVSPFTCLSPPSPHRPGVGIPRPYGEFAPFKPQDAGAGMRHFRPPEHRDIEL